MRPSSDQVIDPRRGLYNEFGYPMDSQVLRKTFDKRKARRKKGKSDTGNPSVSDYLSFFKPSS